MQGDSLFSVFRVQGFVAIDLHHSDIPVNSILSAKVELSLLKEH